MIIKLHYTVDDVESIEIFVGETRAEIDQKILDFIVQRGLKRDENNLWDEEVI